MAEATQPASGARARGRSSRAWTMFTTSLFLSALGWPCVAFAVSAFTPLHPEWAWLPESLSCSGFQGHRPLT